MSEGTIACTTLELDVLSSELSRRGLFGAQQTAAPPSIGGLHEATASASMVAPDNCTAASRGRSRIGLEEGDHHRRFIPLMSPFIPKHI
jgi:hypothetical protein